MPLVPAIFPEAVRSTVLLLRVPFSALLAPVYLMALSQANHIDVAGACWTFVILHLLVYPASNGYNSYVDRDTGPIGGVARPPLPGASLFYTTFALDVLALVASLAFLSATFAALTALYILASRLYSAPAVRLKRYPVWSFLVVFLFQGALVVYLSLTGVTGAAPVPGFPLVWLLFAASFQVAGAYPITQVYQHDDDRAAGITTISMLLGRYNTLRFAGLMFLLSDLMFLKYFSDTGQLASFLVLQLFLAPALLFFARWMRRVSNDPSQAGFRQAMTMSWISAACMNACFILLFFLKT